MSNNDLKLVANQSRRSFLMLFFSAAGEFDLPLRILWHSSPPTPSMTWEWSKSQTLCIAASLPISGINPQVRKGGVCTGWFELSRPTRLYNLNHVFPTEVAIHKEMCHRLSFLVTQRTFVEWNGSCISEIKSQLLPLFRIVSHSKLS